VLRLSHGGVTTALNRGLVAARAELVARMDADDEAKPDRLERQLVVALEAQPDAAGWAPAVRSSPLAAA
jgi:glycosyltransferase involved in cell wall biosynthesis